MNLLLHTIKQYILNKYILLHTGKHKYMRTFAQVVFSVCNGNVGIGIVAVSAKRMGCIGQSYEYLDKKSDVCGTAALFRAASLHLLPQGGMGDLSSARHGGGKAAAGYSDV